MNLNKIRLKKEVEDLLLSVTKNCETDWMLGLVDLEAYNSISNVTDENSKFESNKFPDEKSSGVSYIKVKDEIEKHLDVSKFTASDIESDLIDPFFFEKYREQVTKRMEDSRYTNTLQG